MEFSFYIFILFSFAFSVRIAWAWDSDLTVDIGASRSECFYEVIEKQTMLEIEYQVIDGGDLDINFYITSPTGVVLAAEMKKTDGFHKFDINEIGTYRICFDNTFSRFSHKIVFFEVTVGDEEDDEDDDDDDNWNAEKIDLSELIEIQLSDFRKVIENVRGNLERCVSYQNVLKVYEARDRNIQEQNYDRVNLWSAFQLFIMISVALVQVLMIRNLFDDKSHLSKTFKSRT